MDINLNREIYQYNSLKNIINKNPHLVNILLKNSHKFKDGIIVYRGISNELDELHDKILHIENNPQLKVIKRTINRDRVILECDELKANYPTIMYKRCIHNILPKYKITDINIPLFVLYLRYDILGLMNGNSGAIPPKYYNEILKKYPDTIELFASYFNKTMSRYCCLFGDIEYIFGGLGNIYNHKFAAEGTYVANPPFLVEELNKFARLVKKIPAKSRILIIYPTFDIDHRKLLNKICKNKLVTDYDNNCNTMNIIRMHRCNYVGLYCKGNFSYYDYILNKYIQYASTTLICLNWDIYHIFDAADIILKNKKMI